MDRLLALYSESHQNRPTLPEIAQNLILEQLESTENEQLVRWTNPERLEFEILDIARIAVKFYTKSGRKRQNAFKLPEILHGDNRGMRFFRKVQNQENIFRFHFLPRHLLPKIPSQKTFSEIVNFSNCKETAV